jgi:hypothetical protein
MNHRRRGLSTVLGAVIGLAACGDDSETIQGSVQEVRVGHGSSDGLFLSVDLLVTKAGQAVSCKEGRVKVKVETAFDGEAFAPLAGATQVRCRDEGDYALVVDNSGSEAAFLPDLKEAAARVIDSITAAEGGRASMVRVSTKSTVVAPLTHDAPALHAAVDSLFVNHGWTALWDGIRIGNETLGGAVLPSQARFADLGAFCDAAKSRGVIVFTDGRENNSADEKERPDDGGDGLATTLDDLHKLNVGGVSTPIYAVGLGGDVDSDALAGLASDTGGRYFHVDASAELPDVFGTIASYFRETHQVCAALSKPRCGRLEVRVSWTLEGQGNGKKAGVVASGQTTETLRVACPGDVTAEPGRWATLLLTMSNAGLGDARAATLAGNAVRTVSPVSTPRVLVVLDDGHHGEFPGDARYVANLLRGQGFKVDLRDEPAGGLAIADVAGYDVVWFSNPGYPPDDAATFDALSQHVAGGAGVVLQGDDMAWSWGNGFSMTPYTGLVFDANGTEYCGAWTDNDAGERYRVRFGAEDSPLLAGLAGTTFLYGDDIDSTHAAPGTSVLATANLDGQGGCGEKPVVSLLP